MNKKRRMVDLDSAIELFDIAAIAKENMIRPTTHLLTCFMGFAMVADLEDDFDIQILQRAKDRLKLKDE